jgi:short subunit dehydrogenase-like uncharacterized protein
MDRLDIIVFGATGYTGNFVVKELAKTFRSEKFSWGIAGRYEKKLKELLKSISNENGIFSAFVSLLGVQN